LLTCVNLYAMAGITATVLNFAIDETS
jgi:hypothetical protein